VTAFGIRRDRPLLARQSRMVSGSVRPYTVRRQTSRSESPTALERRDLEAMGDWQRCRVVLLAIACRQRSDNFSVHALPQNFKRSEHTSINDFMAPRYASAMDQLLPPIRPPNTRWHLSRMSHITHALHSCR
jgi:hypothetical protein